MKPYEKPRIVPLDDLDDNGQALTGIPVAAFILVAAVTVFVATFVANVGVGWNAAVGTTAVVSTSTVTKN